MRPVPDAGAECGGRPPATRLPQAEAGRYRRAAQMPAMTKGTLMRKEARQPQSAPSQPMRAPLSTGPTATETPMTPPKRP